MTCVVDASVVLAVLNGERGWDTARAHMRGARLSTVNYSEAIAKAGDQGAAPDKVRAIIDLLKVTLVDFSTSYADAAAGLRASTKGKNVSFADRACLAQAMVDRLPLLTADRAWSRLGLDIEIVQIR